MSKRRLQKYFDDIPEKLQHQGPHFESANKRRCPQLDTLKRLAILSVLYYGQVKGIAINFSNLKEVFGYNPTTSARVVKSIRAR